MQSEATARAEVANTSMDSRLREMEVSQMDVEAERQLAELEMKMTMGGNNVANNYNTGTVQQVQTLGGGTVSANGNGGNGNGASAGESDIDRQLRELEAKLGGQK